MAKYAFYTEFKKKFNHEIKMVNYYHNLLTKDPWRFHHLYKLFNRDKLEFAPGDKAVDILAPYVVGYISTLDKKDSLKNAKSI